MWVSIISKTWSLTRSHNYSITHTCTLHVASPYLVQESYCFAGCQRFYGYCSWYQIATLILTKKCYTYHWNQAYDGFLLNIDLETETSKSFTPHINMNRVTAIQDAKSEINKHIYGTFGNHSKPHWFRFRKTNQRCYMHYKKWESDLWKPEESEEYPNGLLCLKVLF